MEVLNQLFFLEHWTWYECSFRILCKVFPTVTNQFNMSERCHNNITPIVGPYFTIGSKW